MKEICIDAKNEYLASDISLRKLAEKYGIPFSNVQKAARREGWSQLRNQIRDKQNQITVESLAQKRATNSDMAAQIFETLIAKLGEAAQMITPSDVTTARQIVAAMKDLKEIGAYSVGQTDNESIKVAFGEGVDEYA